MDPGPIIPQVCYSFLTAGHTYGAPGVDNEGFHPPFKQAFSYFNSISTLDLCFLTGDVVLSSSDANWEEVDADLALLDCESHIAPGNHDLDDTESYLKYHDEFYKRFVYKNDLFLIFEPYTKGWRISGEQMAMLTQALEEHVESADNIFLFMHHPIWYDEDSVFDSCRPNSTAGREEDQNFFSEVIPLLEQTNRTVVCFAGDFGAFENGCAVMYHEHNDKIKFVGSGMGGGKSDNVVITHVLADGTVEFELVALNSSDRMAMGNLEDYAL